jgi:hypothetical protein
MSSITIAVFGDSIGRGDHAKYGVRCECVGAAAGGVGAGAVVTRSVPAAAEAKPTEADIYESGRVRIMSG